ncbi:DUF6691 family protein [Methyloradius palustris]|uniref:Membrane protein n=1 Tax=Methyloradius palustris TaxID=2778876 RepID=A0A8D5FYB6_9PROT|nr:DUF6691 family protein [Methyloradius palustris]BCM24379.1 membrane protein [Methyloradius palustris]
MQLIFAGLSGIIFGLGLILSGMTNPAKVKGFLDITGLWDPSLAFVMGGAILVGVFAFALAKKRGQTILGESISLPDDKQIDRKLVIGALIFGVGWGLAGYCPGPAIASLLSAGLQPVIFTLGMLAGIGLYKIFQSKQT